MLDKAAVNDCSELRIGIFHSDCHLRELPALSARTRTFRLGLACTNTTVYTEFVSNLEAKIVSMYESQPSHMLVLYQISLRAVHFVSGSSSYSLEFTLMLKIYL